jgi:hypothetical protein
MPKNGLNIKKQFCVWGQIIWTDELNRTRYLYITKKGAIIIRAHDEKKAKFFSKGPINEKIKKFHEQDPSAWPKNLNVISLNRTMIEIESGPNQKKKLFSFFNS